MLNRRIAHSWMLMAALLFFSAALAGASTRSSDGFVYVMSNQATGNSVMVFRRSSNGTLTLMQDVSTKGVGSGGTNDPLMSQGSVVLSEDGTILLAVNAGSNELAAFTVSDSGIAFADKISSGGAHPVSVTEHHGLVYVLNAHGKPNISGFTVDSLGHLRSVRNSRRDLAGAQPANPAEVGFSPDGSVLLVSEKATNQFDVFEVQDDGTTLGPQVQASSGLVPFGFQFAPHGVVVVSEAEGGLRGGGTVSSYQLDSSNNLVPVSAAVPDEQTAPCWVALTRSGKIAFVSNTVSNTISSYEIAADGTLGLLHAAAGFTGAGSGPIDLALSADSSFLYVINSPLGQVSIFAVQGGTLELVGAIQGLPLSSQGIAVR
jgi:6-phosphogluconolactonase